MAKLAQRPAATPTWYRLGLGLGLGEPNPNPNPNPRLPSDALQRQPTASGEDGAPPPSAEVLGGRADRESWAEAAGAAGLHIRRRRSHTRTIPRPPCAGAGERTLPRPPPRAPTRGHHPVGLGIRLRGRARARLRVRVRVRLRVRDRARVRVRLRATATATARVWGGLYAVWPRLEPPSRWISPLGVRWIPPNWEGCGAATRTASPGVHRSLGGERDTKVTPRRHSHHGWQPGRSQQARRVRRAWSGLGSGLGSEVESGLGSRSRLGSGQGLESRVRVRVGVRGLVFGLSLGLGIAAAYRRRRPAPRDSAGRHRRRRRRPARGCAPRAPAGHGR